VGRSPAVATLFSVHLGKAACSLGIYYDGRYL